jgi:NitT/TauT family transport system ATP-binding protein
MATGLDNLSRTEREDRIARWLDATGLREFADSYPKALSGGMRQRLALARTMATLPELVLLDEPLGALDEYTRLGMQKTLSSVVHAAGTSAVMVTHSIQEALLLSDRVLLMSDHPGSILADFSVITRRPRSSDFLKSPEYLTLHESIMERFPNTNN